MQRARFNREYKITIEDGLFSLLAVCGITPAELKNSKKGKRPPVKVFRSFCIDCMGGYREAVVNCPTGNVNVIPSACIAETPGKISRSETNGAENSVAVNENLQPEKGGI